MQGLHEEPQVCDQGMACRKAYALEKHFTILPGTQMQSYEVQLWE